MRSEINNTKCPCCRDKYPTADATAGFREELHDTYVIYALCTKCKTQLSNASTTGQKDIANRCFINIKTKNSAPSGELYPWSFTTEIALHTNAYDLTLALENGQRVPRKLYDLIEYGELDIRCLPTDLYGRALNEY
jgi:hypothetical protein